MFVQVMGTSTTFEISLFSFLNEDSDLSRDALQIHLS